MQEQRIRNLSIVTYAQLLKRKTNDSLKLAQYYNYHVTYIPDPKMFLKAKAVSYDNKKLILINELYNSKERQVLCAHELGHIILHKGENRFDGRDRTKEYEANLFAVAFLLTEEEIAALDLELVDMSNYSLKTILLKLMQ